MRLRRKGENCVGKNACGYGSCAESGCICASRAEYLSQFQACVRATPKRGLWDEIVPKEPISTKSTTTTTTTTTSTRSEKNEEYEPACSKECGEHGRFVTALKGQVERHDLYFDSELCLANCEKVCECDVGATWGATPCF
jgi:hypothetical protein